MNPDALNPLRLPPARHLDIQWRTNLIAVLGDQLLVADPNTREVRWSRDPPPGAHQVAWGGRGPHLFVAADDGWIYTILASTGEICDQERYDDGRVWIDPGVTGDRTVAAASGIVWVQEAPHGERREGWRTFDEIVGISDGAVWVHPAADPSSAIGVKHSAFMRLLHPDSFPPIGVRVRRDQPRAFGLTCTAVAVGPDPSGQGSTVWPAHGDPTFQAAHEAAGEQAFAIPVRGVVGIETASNPGEFYLWTPTELVFVRAPGPTPPILIASLTLPNIRRVKCSLDLRWTAVSTPAETIVFETRAWLNPGANQPDLQDLTQVHEIIAAVRKWKYADREIDRAVANALYFRCHSLDHLDTLPAPVRAWCLADYAVDTFHNEGFATSISNEPDLSPLFPDALDALGHTTFAAAWREALATWEQIPFTTDEQDLPEDENERWVRTFHALDERAAGAARRASRYRMAWLRAHLDAFEQVPRWDPP